MNILFFLTPKTNCAYIRAEDTIRQALERMEAAGFAALPILKKDGTYCGTLTEGDLLWAMMFHRRNNHFIASLHEALCKRRSHQVDTFCCSTSKYNF